VQKFLDEHWRKTFLLWSRKQEHAQLVEKTLAGIRSIIDKYRCVVAYSGGKDSTVMLHLALQIDPDVQVFHWDHGSQLMPREFETEIIDNAKRIGAKYLLVKSSSLLERPDARSNYKVWYLVFWNTLHMTRRAEGWDYQFVGLRKEEGCKRSATIREHRRKGEVYPLEDWKWLDVWAYIVSKDLPYPGIYDRYAALLGYDRARLVTFFDMEFEKYGSLYVDGFLLPGKRNLG
jgi:3'-phosphoadenosine 5'-phosphosulfate sulfotransferase (PAPS reductase)/FAD synthetase